MAKWIALTAPWDYKHPGKRSMVSFKADTTAYMPTDMAEAAIAAGHIEVEKPKGAVTDKSGAIVVVPNIEPPVPVAVKKSGKIDEQ